MAKERTYRSVTFKSNLDDISENIKDQCRETAQEIANLIVKKAEDGFNAPKSGHEYPLPGFPGKTYIASKEGEYPASSDTDGRTGALRRSLETSKAVYANGVARATIGAKDIPYAKYLEGNGLVPGLRPWLAKAYFDGKAEIEAIISSKEWLKVTDLKQSGARTRSD